MITLSKLYSTALDSIGRRVASVFQYGPKQAMVVAPYGDDSNPVQGMDAVYAETENDDEPVIIGYFNAGQLAAPGEKRFYSQKKNEDGSYSQAFYTWLKADGTYEIGGDNYHMVRYEPLNEAIQQQVIKLQSELTKISEGIATAGGVYAPGDITVDISQAKIDEIKCL